MKVVTQPGLWTLLLLLLYLTGEAECAARFLSHVPHDDYIPDADADLPDYDADVKLPGRHYPKLPYRLNPSDAFPEPPYLHHVYQHIHDRSYAQPGVSDYDRSQPGVSSYDRSQPGVSNYGQHRQSRVNIYGHQKGTQNYDYNQNHVSTEPSYDEYGRPFYDTEDDNWRADEGAGGDDTQHVGTPQSDTTQGAPTEDPEASSTGPRFDRSQPRSVTVQAGKTAVLICRVLNIGDKSVSWMRHEDLHILTVDKYKYSTDGRVGVVYNEGKHEWSLKIQGVREEDSGRYECQVSTKPVLSFIVNLEVLESPVTTSVPLVKLRDVGTPADAPHVEKQVPSATILNGPEIHVHRGSVINLTCIVDHTTERPLYIVWYHYNKVIDYESMGGVVVVTQSGHNTVSHLLVKSAESADSGKYTCRPSNGEDASVTLHVLNGEHPAAMQTNTSGRSLASLASAVVVAVTVALSAVVLLCRC